jgi:hypothetical protein
VCGHCVCVKQYGSKIVKAICLYMKNWPLSVCMHVSVSILESMATELSSCCCLTSWLYLFTNVGIHSLSLHSSPIYVKCAIGHVLHLVCTCLY